MQFSTPVEIERPPFQIEPMEQMMFVGSCFASNIGQRFVNEKFRATVNPFGTMYNPASVLHTIERVSEPYRVVFITLGTNHVYRLRETGEIVDNCQKRPAALFSEEKLTVGECADYLQRAVLLLAERNPEVNVVFTVSPIRYRKYGYHGSQLSKATLLLAIDQLLSSTHTSHQLPVTCHLHYFPAYEIFNDELRDYRYYASDMLHPSEAAVDYLWEKITDNFLSPASRDFIAEWAPIRQALAHRPLNGESAEYAAFMEKTMLKVAELQKKYPNFVL